MSGKPTAIKQTFDTFAAQVCCSRSQLWVASRDIDGQPVAGWEKTLKVPISKAVERLQMV